MKLTNKEFVTIYFRICPTSLRSKQEKYEENFPTHPESFLPW